MSDPKPLSSAELDEIEAAADKAMPGPWQCSRDLYRLEVFQDLPLAPSVAVVELPGEGQRNPDESPSAWRQPYATAEFICSARSDVPRLVAEVRRQAKEIEELKASLESAIIDGMGEDA